MVHLQNITETDAKKKKGGKKKKKQALLTWLADTQYHIIT